MSFIRRHLAAFGLAVALLQSTLQAVLPAGLCCASMAEEKTTTSAASEAKTHCCTARSDADGTCPMHRGASKRISENTEPDCRLVCASPKEHGLLSLTLGAPLPSIVTTIATRPAVAAPIAADAPASSIVVDLLTPPPRA